MPYITTILTSAIIAYLFFPLYKWILKKTKRKNLSATIVMVLIVILLLIPSIFIINLFTREISSVYFGVRSRIQQGNIIGEDYQDDPLTEKANYFLVDLMKRPEFLNYIDRAINSIIGTLSTFIVTIPKRIVSFFVMMFLLFFFIRDGELIIQKCEKFVPITIKHKNQVVKKFGDVTHGVIYGYFLTSLVQGVVGLVGLYTFGISSPLIWGIVMMIAAMIPFVGAPVVWIPLGVVKLIQGITAGSTLGILQGAGLLLYGFLVISTIDDIVRPKIIGHRAKIHPVVILLGIVGGVSTFGFIGLFVGPLVLSLLLTFIEIYKNETQS